MAMTVTMFIIQTWKRRHDARSEHGRLVLVFFICWLVCWLVCNSAVA